MTERILGESGSPRRRRFLWVPVLLTAAFALFWIAGAQAVHEAGVFELDALSANAEDEAADGDDWDNICADNPSTCTFKTGESASASSAASSSHEDDGDLNATIFQGGGSKDEQPIANWLWKDGAGGLPDKDNLLHAYAARYTVPTSDECVGAGGNTDGTEDCSLIYFGSDRYANDGDATQAFWFLQNKVAADGPASKGGNTFTGSHREGDILIISEFSNGGTKSDIAVYKWVGDDATGGLEFLAGGDNKDCDLAPDNDPFCGIVNKDQDPTFSPWEFLDKDDSTDFRQGELFEAGINLSDPSIDLSEECFSSFVAETRSSTSLTATLKDFVVGQFEVCVPAMDTDASTSGSVPVGTAVHDTATITVTGAANPADPTGDVSFSLCGPAASKAAAACTTGGADAGTNTLDGGANTTDGIASADSDDVNTATSPLAPGFYCFRADWPGDATYPGALSFTNTDDECFQVIGSATLQTRQRWLPNDAAQITGPGALSGNATFTLYNDLTCGAGTGTAQYTQIVPVSGTDSVNVSTSNSTFHVTANNDGSAWSWKVSYADAVLTDPADECETTSAFTITD